MLKPAELVTLERRLSPERLAPYRATAGGDLRKAIELYSWNRMMSGAFAVALGDVEVVLRNSMHEQLTLWSSKVHGEPLWYLDPGRILLARQAEHVQNARTEVARQGHPETPGRVVAELSFGFWRYLLSSQYHRTMWNPALWRAFPHGRPSRRNVYQQVVDLHLLRNRIAHHEPIHNRPLGTLHATMLDVLGYICPVSQTWINDTCQVRSVMALRP